MNIQRSEPTQEYRQKFKTGDFSNSFFAWESIHAFWYERLFDMAISSIRWDGMDFVPKNRLEFFLTTQTGQVAYFEDPIIGAAVLPCVGEGGINAYGLPSSYTIYGENSYIKTGMVDGRDCVVILNNQIGNTDVKAINLYADRLTNSMLTGEINLQVQKTPFIIETDENDRLTMQNVLAKITSGVTKIFTTRGLLREDNVKVHDLKAPFLVDRITENTQILWNEWLNYLGVPSQIVQKKERMLKDEVTQVMGGALASRTGRMSCREEAAKKIKEIFGRKCHPYYAIDRTPIPEYIGDVNHMSSMGGGFDG